MALLIQDHHENNIRNGQLKEIAELLRSGKVSELSPHTLRLLADYLDGKFDKKRGGQAADFGDDEAEKMYSTFQSLIKYGCTPAEIIILVEPSITDGEKTQKIYLDLEEHGMTKTAAYETMSKTSYSLTGRGLSPESVRKIVNHGKMISINEIDTTTSDFY